MSGTLEAALERHRAGDLAAAAPLYDRVLAEDPLNFDALHLKGALLRKSGNAKAAVAAIEKAIAAHPARGDSAALNLANALFDCARYADAAKQYARALAAAPNDAVAHARYADALQMAGDTNGGIAAYRRALALAPGDSNSWHNLAHALQKADRPQEALEAAKRALALRPDYPEALNACGNALVSLERPKEALSFYRRAIAGKPDFAELYGNLGNALRALGLRDEARENYDRAVALNESAPGQTKELSVAYYNRANLALDTLDHQSALADFEKAIAHDPDSTMANLNASLTRLQGGDFKRGWPDYEWRWRDSGLASSRRKFDVPRWTGAADIKGKRLLLYAEQGFGDTLQFVRYVPMAAARGGHVVLEVQPPLRRLLDGFAGAAQIVARGEPVPPVDFECPLLSLPLAFATDLDSVPAPLGYLKAEPAAVAAWQKRLGAKTGPRIGFVCSGSATHKNDKNRSIAMRNMLAIAPEGMNFICLQKELRPADAAFLRSRRDVPFFGDTLADFADTAALIANMDLVVTVDTSVAHLAGALGKPTWVLLPYNPDWRWLLGRSDSPWYPNMRLFRQKHIAAWAAVLDEVGAALRALPSP